MTHPTIWMGFIIAFNILDFVKSSNLTSKCMWHIPTLRHHDVLSPCGNMTGGIVLASRWHSHHYHCHHHCLHHNHHLHHNKNAWYIIRNGAEQVEVNDVSKDGGDEEKKGRPKDFGDHPEKNKLQRWCYRLGRWIYCFGNLLLVRCFRNNFCDTFTADIPAYISVKVLGSKQDWRYEELTLSLLQLIRKTHWDSYCALLGRCECWFNEKYTFETFQSDTNS